MRLTCHTRTNAPEERWRGGYSCRRRRTSCALQRTSVSHDSSNTTDIDIRHHAESKRMADTNTKMPQKEMIIIIIILTRRESTSGSRTSRRRNCVGPIDILGACSPNFLFQEKRRCTQAGSRSCANRTDLAEVRGPVIGS